MKSTELFEESWFYAPDIEDGLSALTLPEGEAHHAFHVLRLRPGRKIVITNGKGDVFAARLEGDAKGATVTDMRRHREVTSKPRASLAMALLKGKDTEEPVAACCQLPLSDIFLLVTEHAQVFAKQEFEKLLQRLRQKSVTALKQARKPYLTHIHAPMTLSQWRQAFPELALVYAHPGQDTLPAQPSTSFSLAIGPEGGFSEREMAWFEGQPQSYRLGLGATRLRAETAPLVGFGKLMGLGWLV